MEGTIEYIIPGPIFLSLEENSTNSYRFTIPVNLRKGLVPNPAQPELVWIRNDRNHCLQIHPVPFLIPAIEEQILSLPLEERARKRQLYYQNWSVIEVTKDYRCTLPKLADLPTSYAFENCQRIVIVGFGKYAYLFSEVAYYKYLSENEREIDTAALLEGIAK
ncbi:MAG: hypothetical protein N2450_09405 [bacterium]|nr:hypothetical protein [bacterium]